MRKTLFKHTLRERKNGPLGPLVMGLPKKIINERIFGSLSHEGILCVILLLFRPNHHIKLFSFPFSILLTSLPTSVARPRSEMQE